MPTTKREKNATNLAKESTGTEIEVPKVRSLKIQSKYRASRARILNKPKPSIVPELILCGKWLQELGFNVNARVAVYASDQQIVIRPLELEE